MRRRVFVFVLLIVLSTACMSRWMFENTVESWVGADIQRLVNAWGEPKSITESDTGNKIYVYQIYRRPKDAGDCTVFFEVDADNTIVGWDHEGDYCRQFDIL